MKKSIQNRIRKGLFPEMPQSFADRLTGTLKIGGAFNADQRSADEAPTAPVLPERSKRRFPFGKIFNGVAAAVLAALCIVIAVFGIILPNVQKTHGATRPDGYRADFPVGKWTLTEVEANGSKGDPALIGMEMALEFQKDGSVTVTTVTGGAEGQYVYHYSFADNTIELTADDAAVPVLPASGTYDPETNTLRFANEDGDGALRFSRKLNEQTLLGVWKQTRTEHAVDPSPFEWSTYEPWEYIEWEKSQTWEEADNPMIPEYLEFTADGRMYDFIYASDGGVQFNQSGTYTISGDIILWSNRWMPMRYEAETDTICWILPDTSREFYERASETEIVDPYRQKLSELRKQYPEYFGLDTFQTNRLKVYVWQMAEGSYSCALVSGTDARSEIEIGMMRSVTIEEMRMILETYYEARDCNIEPENVEVIPFQNPISSYAYEIDEAYTGRLRWLLTGIPFECDDPLYSAPLDSKINIDDGTLTLDVSMVCDVDGDGRYETCMLTYGPTSGLFTFTLSAYRDGTAIYRNTFQTANGYFHLQRMTDGLNLYYYDAADTTGWSTATYAVTIENGMIVLTNEKTRETVEYWGLADPHWNMKVPAATPEEQFGGAWYCYYKGLASYPGYDELLVIEFDPDGKHVSFTEDRRHYEGYSWQTDADDPNVLILTNETTGDVRRATLETDAKLRFETDLNARGERSEWTYYSLPILSAEDLPYGEPANLWQSFISAHLSGTDPAWCNGPLGMFDLDGDGKLELIRLTWNETDRKMTVEAFTNHNRAAYTGYTLPGDFGTNEGELYYTVENVTNPENFILIDLDPSDGHVNLLVSAVTENGEYTYELHVENGALVCGHVIEGYCYLEDSEEDDRVVRVPTLVVQTDLFGADGYREVRGEALEPVDDRLYASAIVDAIFFGSFGSGREKHIEDGTLLHLVRALPCEIDGKPATLEPGVYLHLREWHESMDRIVFLTEDDRWITVHLDGTAPYTVGGVPLADYFDNAPNR